MPIRGSAYRAEGNKTLRTVCANCGKSIPTEAGHAHPLDEAVEQETWGLVGALDGERMVFSTCAVCHDVGWKPPAFAGMN